MGIQGEPTLFHRVGELIYTMPLAFLICTKSTVHPNPHS